MGLEERLLISVGGVMLWLWPLDAVVWPLFPLVLIGDPIIGSPQRLASCASSEIGVGLQIKVRKRSLHLCKGSNFDKSCAL